MPRSRPALAGTLLLVLVALAVPAVSLAGGSAGDQQYTDPFGGGSGSATPTASRTTTVSATTTANAQTTASAAPSTTPPASAGSAGAGGDPTTATAAPATTGQPTATIAGGSTKSLPYTGYDAWTAVGFGLTLVAGGAVLRWRLRPHGR